jgi:hypothetical protein
MLYSLHEDDRTFQPEQEDSSFADSSSDSK